MATTKRTPKTQASSAYEAAQEKARAILIEIGKRLDHHAVTRSANPMGSEDWGYVGDINWLAEKLEELRGCLPRAQ